MNLGDLSKTPHDDVLDEAEARLRLRISRQDGHYSALNGTAGFPTDAGTWVRLSWHRPAKVSAQAITGFEAALGLDGVPRPVWKAAAAWHDRGRDVVWRAEEMTRSADPAVSETATIAVDPGLPEAWWSELRAACTTLARYETSRLCVSQEHRAVDADREAHTAPVVRQHCAGLQPHRTETAPHRRDGGRCDDLAR
ncbi:hypothetical protein [Actinomadura rayongensis]|uniref:hypothetical protein n=1 Tax=Actinomadura rayongensis TaxID=1429076 RepID=UPI001926DE30|nr:hypothetical protein [Actinomadura rayongensis]